MNKYFLFLSIVLILLFLSCSESNYITIEEVPEIDFNTGSYSIQDKYNFTNKVNGQNVSILNSIDKTGFHFYNGVKFKTEDIGVLVGGTGLRARITRNGGESWREFRFSKFANVFHSVAFSGNTIFIIGESKYIFRSNDFGETWNVFNSEVLFEEENSFTQSKFYKIRFTDDEIGFIVGERSNIPIILKTINGGKRWEIVNDNETLKNSGAITDISVQSSKNLTIVTSLGRCYRTTDGGNNWELICKTNPLYSVAFKNRNEGYIGGVNGVLYYTDNGGKDWISMEVPENPKITDIVFLDNKVLITTSISSSEDRATFVYGLDENGRNIYPFITKANKNVRFMGDAFAIDILENNVYILDRNNLYKTTNK